MISVEEPREMLDLSHRGLKKVEPANEEGKTAVYLNLDNNELQRLDNLDTYSRLEQLSICNNFLQRMHGVLKVTNLRVLCLNNNGILQIEGLKEMIYLKTLKLSGNKIKSIEHLHHNMHLEHLDLSNNHISFMADISYLKNLKYLNLDYNRLVDLRQCDRYLPPSLQHLGLAHNRVEDLTELCHLAHLKRLESFTIQGNPCINMAGREKIGFDYRPYVLNWILSLKSIDGFVVSAMESIKAEWLYGQADGRAYRPGQHAALCEYLATVCPLSTDLLETEEQTKLRLILTKAQHHQMQLKEQNNSPVKSRLQSPRMQSRISSRNIGKSPDRLSMSYHSSVRSNSISSPSPMSMSCSGDISSNAVGVPLNMCQSYDSPGVMFTDKKAEVNSKDVKNTIEASAKVINQPLEAASKMVPVPESLMSPDYQEQFDLQRNIAKANQRLNISNSQATNSPQDRQTIMRKGSPKVTRSAMSSPKLRTRLEQRKGSLTKLDIKSMNDANDMKSVNGNPTTKKPVGNSTSEQAEIRHNKTQGPKPSPRVALESAALTIQRVWRGYHSRNLNRRTQSVLHAIQSARARQHIQRLTCDMEATKAALDSERKIQQLQMQAINALWKKVSALQNAGEVKVSSSGEQNSDAMRLLTETCFSLQTQVVELQSCMQEVVKAVSILRVSPVPGPSPAPAAATQTDIIAVLTPQEERTSFLRRPQSLALSAASAPAAATVPGVATPREEEMQGSEQETEQEFSLAEDSITEQERQPDIMQESERDKHCADEKASEREVSTTENIPGSTGRAEEKIIEID